MQHRAPAFFVCVRTAADKSPAVFSMMEKENPFGLPKTGPITCFEDKKAGLVICACAFDISAVLSGCSS
jgi:hypothetical protein